MINESTKEDFMSSVYDLLADEPSNDKAKTIIDFFDTATVNCIESPCRLGDTIYLKSESINGKKRLLNLTVVKIAIENYLNKDSIIITAAENVCLVGKAPNLFKLESSCFGKVAFTNIEEALNQDSKTGAVLLHLT